MYSGSIIDYSRRVIDDSICVVDDSGVILQLVSSFTIVIFLWRRSLKSNQNDALSNENFWEPI